MCHLVLANFGVCVYVHVCVCVCVCMRALVAISDQLWLTIPGIGFEVRVRRSPFRTAKTSQWIGAAVHANSFFASPHLSSNVSALPFV